MQIAAETAEHMRTPAPPQLSRDAELCGYVVGWLQLLGEWQGWVHELAAWKYCVPASDRCGTDGHVVGGVREGAGGAGGAGAGWEQYRRVVADNYSAEDKEALLEVTYICVC